MCAAMALPSSHDRNHYRQQASFFLSQPRTSLFWWHCMAGLLGCVRPLKIRVGGEESHETTDYHVTMLMVRLCYYLFPSSHK